MYTHYIVFLLTIDMSFFRLSEQAQRHLQDSEKFEDILLGTSRPTLVIQRYQELYSQGRVEALDAIETIENGDRIFSTQLVLDVMKVLLLLCMQGP